MWPVCSLNCALTLITLQLKAVYPSILQARVRPSPSRLSRKTIEQPVKMMKSLILSRKVFSRTCLTHAIKKGTMSLWWEGYSCCRRVGRTDFSHRPCLMESLPFVGGCPWGVSAAGGRFQRGFQSPLFDGVAHVCGRVSLGGWFTTL